MSIINTLIEWYTYIVQNWNAVVSLMGITQTMPCCFVVLDWNWAWKIVTPLRVSFTFGIALRLTVKHMFPLKQYLQIYFLSVKRALLVCSVFIPLLWIEGTRLFQSHAPRYVFPLLQHSQKLPRIVLIYTVDPRFYCEPLGQQLIEGKGPDFHFLQHSKPF